MEKSAPETPPPPAGPPAAAPAPKTFSTCSGCVPVVVRLAYKRMDVGAISNMMVGTIIEFDKLAGEELELMIRDKSIGYGVAVKASERYGLRITSLCDLREAIAAMGPEKESS